jgi:hypothetical protein
VSQVSLSLVLLMGAFVFVTSFRNLTTLDLNRSGNVRGPLV